MSAAPRYPDRVLTFVDARPFPRYRPDLSVERLLKSGATDGAAVGLDIAHQPDCALRATLAPGVHQVEWGTMRGLNRTCTCTGLIVILRSVVWPDATNTKLD